MLPIKFKRVLPVFRLFSLPLLLSAGLLASVQAHAEVEVLTSIKPLQLIAAAVQDGVGKPAVLLPPGASPHHYAMRPSDVRQIRSADLFYWIGPDMETFLVPVLKGREKPDTAVQSLPGMTLRHFGEGAHHAHAHHEHEHEHEHEEDHGSQHSEIHAHYHFECATPQALTGLDLQGLFKTFPGTEKIQGQLIGPNGQRGVQLTAKQPRAEF